MTDNQALLKGKSMRKLDSILDRAVFAIRSPELAMDARELTAFGLRAPDGNLEFFLSYEVRDCSQEDSINEYVDPVLEHIKRHRSKYGVFRMNTSDIFVLAPLNLAGSDYLLEINVLALVIGAYPALYEVVCLKSEKWERPFYPYAFNVLDGCNGWHSNHGFVDFETMSFIGRHGSRLGSHCGSRSEYQPRMDKNAIVHDPIETIAKACGVTTKADYLKLNQQRKATRLAYQYLRKTFFKSRH